MSLRHILGFLALISAFSFGQNADAKRILGNFEKQRPDADAMAIYQLDWEEDLSAALARAQSEDRPIFFIWVSNITGPDNFFSGHC